MDADLVQQQAGYFGSRHVVRDEMSLSAGVVALDVANVLLGRYASLARFCNDIGGLGRFGSRDQFQ